VYSIVGKNGSGKSTLVGLLTKLNTPSEDKIHINGSDFATIPDESWLKQLAVIPQKCSELWDFSVQDNIAFGCHELLGADPNYVIHKEAEYFGVTTIVDLDTYFGDKWNSKAIPDTEDETRVDDFSGGQWQAIALARTFCRRDSARVFILDEPSSALDPVREHDLFERLR
jgi:ATP-binding cassette, subfamily B, bacterial NisT/SpaT